MANVDQELPVGMNRIAGDRVVPTKSELDKISSALQDPKFRELLIDYANQMNSPNNRRTYEAEMTALEAEKGVKCTFLHPNPGYVIKTRGLDDHVKAFVNVCFDDNVGMPELISPPQPIAAASPKPARTKAAAARKRSGQCWSLPYFQAQPHPERDTDGKECNVYDVIFNPAAEAKAAEDPRFKRLLDTTSMDAVEKAFDVRLDRNNMKFPKLKFKGSFRPTVIREPLNNTPQCQQQEEAPSENDNQLKEQTQQLSQEKLDNDFVTPTYAIKYKSVQTDLPVASGSSDPCRPTHLVVDIALTGLVSAKAVDLDVTERSLVLECAENCVPRYKLELDLAYPVLENDGAAKFDKATGSLAVTLPVRPAPQPPSLPPVSRLVSTDSGIGMEDEEELREKTKAKAEDTKEEKKEEEEEGTLPPYTCNIYEDLMVFKLDVKNVNPESLTKEALSVSGCHGFTLRFENVGAGMVPFRYAFQMGLVTSQDINLLDKAEIDVWDNNVIVQFAIPAGPKTYKVGSTQANMTEHPLPQLKEFRMKKDQLKNKNGGKGLKDVTNIDGKNKCQAIPTPGNSTVAATSGDDEDSSDEKERHSSGESVDSALSFSLSSVASGGEEPKRGILKHPKRCVRRCFSESHTTALMWNNSEVIDSISEVSEEEEGGSSKGQTAAAEVGGKKVSFNEVVKRQVFKANASILAQKNKSMKKAEQKARKEAKRTRSMGSIEGMRRASEGDAATLSADGFKISSSFETSLKAEVKLGGSPRTRKIARDITASREDGHDSGVASSYEDHHQGQAEADGKTLPAGKVNSKKADCSKKGTKNKQQLPKGRSELIFHLDE